MEKSDLQQTGFDSAAILAQLPRALRGSSIHQVYAHVRDSIENGRIAPGQRLPPTGDLAGLWDLPVATVHKGMNLLVKEGFVSRRNRLGTFVCKPRTKIETIGCYLPANMLASPSGFYASVYRAIDGQCRQAGLTCRLLADPRSADEQYEPWPELVRMTELGRIDAVVGQGLDFLHIQWLDRLSVPVAYFSSARTRHAVTFDAHRFARDGIGILVKQGCRHIGVISGSIWHHLRSHGLINRGVAAFVSGLHAARRKHDIDLIQAGLDEVGIEAMTRAQDHCELGYTIARRLLERRPDIDGLLVYPDSVARGVLYAVLERSARGPQPRLVLHRNRERPFFCPLPTTWIESSAEDLAQALLDNVRGEDIRAGKRVRLVDFRVVEDLRHEKTAPVETNDREDRPPTGRGESS